MCWVIAAGSARHHIGMAQRVEQRGLAVSDVAITVTTGERGSVSVGSSTMSNRPSSDVRPRPRA